MAARHEGFAGPGGHQRRWSAFLLVELGVALPDLARTAGGQTKSIKDFAQGLRRYCVGFALCIYPVGSQASLCRERVKCLVAHIQFSGCRTSVASGGSTSDRDWA